MDQPQNADRPNAVNSSHHGQPAGSPPEPAAEAQAPPQTFSGWLVQNAPVIIVVLALAGWFHHNFGFEGDLKALLVAIGLGFVIFIHELGHFLAAKWSDVHVQTFSIGFGPALPGCSFVRGETTYKIAAFPLGGYVNMVGEGPEGEENEDYPRSFKNKTVGQRMLIISAGVIMNVLFGFACFVFVYLFHGERVLPAQVWRIDAGSPAWQAGVRTGSTITRIGSNRHPSFDDLRVAVALSDKGEIVAFVFDPRDGNGSRREIDLEPRRDANDVVPIVGIAPPDQLKLYPRSPGMVRELPVLRESPAAAARVLDLKPNDTLIASSEAGKEGLTPLTGDRKARLDELCRRLMTLKGEPFELEVKRAGMEANEKISLPPQGFDFEDQIVATTDPNGGDVFTLSILPLDPTDESHKALDAFEFRRRLKALAGKPMAIQVKRKKGGVIETLLVPPAYRYAFGMKMQMGVVAGVRQGFAAERAGVQPRDEAAKIRGDILSKVTVLDADGKPVGEPLVIATIDPMRLPYELSHRVAGVKDAKIQLSVLRPNPEKHRALEEKTLPPVVWDVSWNDNEEQPVGTSSPMSIPQLGLAYQVESTVVGVEKGSPAEAAGVQPHDRVEKIALRIPSRTGDEWTEFFEMKSKRLDNQEEYDQWAHYFWWLERTDSPEVQLKLNRNGASVTVELKGQPDSTWPMAERGLALQQAYSLQKAHGFGEALGFGVNRTLRFIKQIYLNLKNFASGRISPKLLGGPIEIGKQAFAAAEDFYTLVLFLGIISVNLAVVNALPIPLLDGGHMVFLIYEKIRGKALPEAVRAPAMYVGLALLASLMIFVFYQDIMRLAVIKKLLGN